LRESGAIEQDADMVCFIHRPEYYKILEDEKGNSLVGLAEIIIAKHRNGATGDVLLRFKGEIARFQNLEDNNTGYMDRASKMLPAYNNSPLNPTQGLSPDDNGPLPF
jgi:replicative DNA helicase